MNDRKKNLLTTISLVIVGIALAAIIGVIVYRYLQKDDPGQTTFNKKEQKEEQIVNNLDGLKSDKKNYDRHPLAVMVENHPDSRPQVGLDKASIVYEAITEGGITRFMAVYGPRDADKIGPVRSARTYFIDWVKEFDAFYAHVGGNLDALNKIKSDDIKDLDEFALGEKAYWRDSSLNRAVEHTMFTSTKLLYQEAKLQGYMLNDADFTAFKFNKNFATDRTESQEISIPFSTASYDVMWLYNKDSNSYLRSMAGKKHVDGQSGAQLSATTVIIQSVARELAPLTDVGEQGFQMDTIGTGKALVFSQGEKINATWEKKTQKDRTLFYYADGENKGDEIEFLGGQFWIEIVPPDVYRQVTVE